jgi:hypothetical protein
VVELTLLRERNFAIANLCVAKYHSGGGRGLKEAVAVWSPAI